MRYFSLNRTALVGIGIALVALGVFAFDYFAEEKHTLRSVFGIEGRAGNAPISLILILVAAFVYTTGRIVDIVQKHRAMYRRSSRPEKE